MNNKLSKYFEEKKYSNSFIKNTIERYINDHIKCFGNKITEDMIIERLSDNLDTVKIINCEASDYKLTNKQVASKYNGFDNMIYLYVVKDLVNDKMYKEYIRDTLYHSLTHAVYFIKDGARENIASEMFGTVERDEINKNIIVLKNDDFVEAITNFISTKMTGRGNGQYIYETKMMNRISSIIDPSLVAESAWTTDIVKFEKALLPINKENIFQSLGYCFRLCKYEEFKDIAADRFNAIIEGTEITCMPVEREPSKTMKIIAACKMNDTIFIDNIFNNMSKQERLYTKVEIKNSQLLTEQEKENLFGSLIREK